MVWWSKLETTVALSIAEAEYMAIYVVVQEVLFLRQLLGNLDPAPYFRINKNARRQQWLQGNGNCQGA